MAFTPRTATEIYDEMIAEKNANFPDLVSLQPNIDSAQTLLNDLGTNSQVAEWRLWVWLVAFAQSSLEKLFGIYKTEVEAIANKSHFGTLPWYRYMALNYQHGDALDFIDNQWKYPAIDLTAQIVKKAAATSNPGVVFVKVAKDGGAPLTASESTAFGAYIASIAPPGINTTIISQDPDDLIVDVKVYYDPLVLAADGSLLATPATFPVEDAIIAYIENIDFDGKFIITKFQDSIQLAEGVVDPIINGVESRYGANPFAPIVESHNAFSGHFRIHPSTPLNTQITYIANV